MLQSGIPDLDRILGGGLPEGDVVLVTGPAGSGKTTFCFQVAFHLAAQRHKVAYVSTMSESPARLIRHLRTFSFFDLSQIGKCLLLQDIYPIIKEGLPRTVAALVSLINDQRIKLLILDGLDTIRDIHAGSIQLRTFLFELAVALAPLGCTTLMTSGAVLAGDNGRTSSPELTMCDTLIVLGKSDLGTRAVRTIASEKVRGQSPLLGIHSMRIDHGGIHVFPRIESFPVPAEPGLNRERLSFGLAELDAMSTGGLSRGSATLVAGPLGTGKTLLALQYVLAGAQRGERGLVIGFRESPRVLLDRMRGFGLDLETPLEQGLIRFLHPRPIDLLADDLFGQIARLLQDFAPVRLVIDSVDEVEHAIEDERRQRSALVCLVELLRAHGVTALLTKELSKFAGPEPDFSASPLAVVAENVIVLRDVEFQGDRYRVLSILKMRQTAHDRGLRQYEITASGLKVVALADSPAGLLAGRGHLVVPGSAP